MARKLPRLRDFGVTGLSSQVLTWSQRVAEQTEANFADQQTQIDTINNILDDNTLTPDKKPVWIFMYSFLTGEQSGVDAEATTYGITTEKTNYDTAVSALTTYLGTLTTAVAWNDLTGNTTIVGTAFRTKFNDVLVKKQALLNKMHDTARSLANTAQSTANTGVTNAAAAQSTANTATTNAATAQATANTVKRDDSITSSYPAPGDVLTASDAGSDATISVASHSRVYGDISNVAVNSGSITGQAYSTTFYVYYDDASRTGGAVTYHADTNINHALPNKAAGRHYVGSVPTPAAGAGTTTGGTSPPAGGGGIDKTDVHSTL